MVVFSNHALRSLEPYTFFYKRLFKYAMLCHSADMLCDHMLRLFLRLSEYPLPFPGDK